MLFDSLTVSDFGGNKVEIDQEKYSEALTQYWQKESEIKRAEKDETKLLNLQYKAVIDQCLTEKTAMEQQKDDFVKVWQDKLSEYMNDLSGIMEKSRAVPKAERMAFATEQRTLVEEKHSEILGEYDKALNEMANTVDSLKEKWLKHPEYSAYQKEGIALRKKYRTLHKPLKKPDMLDFPKS